MSCLDDVISYLEDELADEQSGLAEALRELEGECNRAYQRARHGRRTRITGFRSTMSEVSRRMSRVDTLYDAIANLKARK